MLFKGHVLSRLMTLDIFLQILNLTKEFVKRDWCKLLFAKTSFHLRLSLRSTTKSVLVSQPAEKPQNAQ